MASPKRERLWAPHRRPRSRKVRKIRFTGFRGRTWSGAAAAVIVLASALAAGAQTPAPPAPGSPPIVPGSLSGSGSAEHAPGTVASPPSGSAASAAPAGPQPSAGPRASPASRFHLHRPGTDVDGDLLTGNSASAVYVFHGDVVLHSDPKIDRTLGAATESDEPLTVTADEIDVDEVGLAYVAKGHVHFVQGSRSGRADVAMLNDQTGNLDLLGNADVLDGDRRVRAAKMHYNIGDRTFHGFGDVRIYQPVPSPAPRPSATAPSKRRRRLPI